MSVSTDKLDQINTTQIGKDPLLFHESCFDFMPKLPDNSVDLVLIDPPYEISRETGFASGEKKGTDVDRFRVSMDFGDWDSSFEGLDEVVSQAYRALRKGGTLISFYDVWKLTTLREYLEEAGFKQIRLIEWLKTNPVPLNSHVNYLTNAREIAVSGVKGSKPTFHSEYDNGQYIYPICRDKGRFHPTQKPVALLEDLIRKHSNEGDLIVDCFAGSASAAVAAYKTGRRFVGCEADGRYYEQCVKRLGDLTNGDE